MIKSLYRFIRFSGYRKSLFNYPRYLFDPDAQQSRKKMQAYHNQFKERRCVIIGNGPSLNVMDLSFLEHEYTFGLNRIYLKFDEWGFKTKFLVCTNPNVLEQFAEDFQLLDIPKFFPWQHRQYFDDKRSHAFYMWSLIDFSQDASRLVFGGPTVTYAAMQLAYYMGFETVYLIGVDHNFHDKGKPNTLVTTKDQDRNHFSPDYFGKGVKWQLPDLDRSERVYSLAKDIFERDGRKIIDATVGGKLQIYPKQDYQSIFFS